MMRKDYGMPAAVALLMLLVVVVASRGSDVVVSEDATSEQLESMPVVEQPRVIHPRYESYDSSGL